MTVSMAASRPLLERASTRGGPILSVPLGVDSSSSGFDNISLAINNCSGNRLLIIFRTVDRQTDVSVQDRFVQ